MKSSVWWWIGGLAGLAVLLVLLILSRTQYSGLQADLEAAETQNSSLSSQLAQAQSDLSSLQVDYNDVSQQLADIRAVFPPGEFASSDDLQAWLDANAVSTQPTTTYAEWYANALQLQQDALNDGYIISVSFDYYPDEDHFHIYCETVINGWIWYWDPETDDIFQSTGFGPVN